MFTSAALGRHEAIFMSHPTTILNTCQQKNVSEKENPFDVLQHAEFLRVWKLCPLVRNDCTLTLFFFPFGLLCASKRPPFARKQFCSFSGKVCHLVLAHSFAGAVFIKGKPSREMKCYKGEVQSRLNFHKLGDASDLYPSSNFDFYVAVWKELIKCTALRDSEEEGSEVWTTGFGSFCGCS